MAKTAYLVDDNTSALQHNIITCKNAGLEVVGYHQEPLVALAELQGLNATGKCPDIICLDIIMPEMDGIELYRKLTAAKLPSRIIFVTALAAEGKFVGHFAKSIGGEKFLAKPLTEASLKQALSLAPSQSEAAPPAQEAKQAEPPPPPQAKAQPEPKQAKPQPEHKPERKPDDQQGQGEHIEPYGRDPKL